MGWLYNIDSVDGEEYLKIIRLRRLILLSSLLFFSVHIFSIGNLTNIELLFIIKYIFSIGIERGVLWHKY